MRCASILLVVCVLLAGQFVPALADARVFSGRTYAAMPSSITLELIPPEYGPCGDVSINGYVAANPGSVTGMSWDWGDGIVSDSWFPASHHYVTNGSRTVAVTAYADTGETRTETSAVVIANATGAGCDLVLHLHPPTVFLLGGNVTQPLRLEIRDADGRLVSPIGRQAIFTSTQASLVQVNAAGIVSGTGFGEAEIQASVQGVARPAKARVILGRFRVAPPILLLSPVDQPTGALTIHALNADGTPVDLGSHAIGFTGGSFVASVDAGGAVTAHAPPVSFGDSPYFDAHLDDRSGDNAAFTRVTTNTLGLTVHQYDGTFTSLRVADQVGPYPFASLMTTLQAVTVSDDVYRLQQRLTGVTPFRGDTQYFVMDPGYEDGTVPCGISGNPVRLGIAVDSLNSCVGGTDWLHWGVMYHEMGHNFMIQEPFSNLVLGMPDEGTYMEGMASMLAIHAMDTMLDNPGAYGLGTATIENLSRSSIPLTPAFARDIFFAELAAYEANPDYANLFTADVLDGILVKLHDLYGHAFFYRSLSLFAANDGWNDLHPVTHGERLAVLVAAFSAAARADLLPRFRDTWGFPVDQAYYAQVYPAIERMVARRDPAGDAGRDRLAPLGQSVTLDDAYSFDWEQDALSLTWQVVTRPAGSTAALSDPTALHPSFQPDRLGHYLLSLTADDGLIVGASDTVTVTACSLAAPQVSISSSGFDVVLGWTDQFADYEVYEHDTNPYFTPAAGNLIGTGHGSFRHRNALAPPAVSRYYFVKAICGGEASSAHVGAFSFSLTPGSP